MREKLGGIGLSWRIWGKKDGHVRRKIRVDLRKEAFGGFDGLL